jgi:hypothetical protein
LEHLLQLQELDLKIEACSKREVEIPKQKNKFDVQKKNLSAEIEAREEACKKLELEQRECEGDIEQRHAQIGKYNEQLLGVKKNEEYTALLHEIDGQKKQIALKEERIISIMVEMDEGKARLAEDKKRVAEELADIDRQCKEIDGELSEAIKNRQALEAQRQPYIDKVEAKQLTQYQRLRGNKKSGAVLVPMRGETCGGCHMTVRPQIANEILGGDVHGCQYCGRLLYHEDRVSTEVDAPSA